MAVQLGFLGFLLIQSAVICVVLLALCDVVQRAFGLDRVLTISTTMVVLGAIGYACFWLAFFNYKLFGIVKIASLLTLFCYLGIRVYRGDLVLQRWLAEPLLYTFLFLAAALTLCFVNGGFEDPGATALARYGYAGDNLIPRTFADHLRNPALRLETNWLSSDRPPLQTGLYLFLALQTGGMGYQVVASWLQASFLIGVWVLTIALILPVEARRMVMLACCILPTTITNTYYTWPKMLVVGYALIAFALLFFYQSAKPRERNAVGFLTGAAVALAMLSHGGAAFAFIGFAIVIAATSRWPSWYAIASGGVAFILFYAPWLAYQRFVDPPGNRLLKWHLANVKEVDDRGFLQALSDTYSALSLNDYVRGRLANIAAMIGDWPRHLQDLFELVIAPNASLLRKVHDADFYALVPSLHVFSIAVVVVAALLFFWRDRLDRRAAATILGAIVSICAAAAVLLIVPGSATNHSTTYVIQVMLTIFAFFILSKCLPAAWLFIALQLITVTTAYGLAMEYDARLWTIWIACVAATIGLLGYSLAPTVLRLARTGSRS